MTDSLTLPHPPMAAGGPLPGPGLPRLLPESGAVPVDLRAHLAAHGPLRPAGGRDGLLREVAAAGLTGRGGAAFPAARKLAAAAQARPAPVVVGNGAEGEPASSKDRSLLWISPHLVLDGLQLAAGAAGSAAAVLYVPRNERLHGRLAAAIAERAAAGIDAARVELVTAPDRFLAGEESALVSRLAGRPAVPAYRPVRGLPRLAPGRAALVQNVETLAHLALIARYGAAWFRTAGHRGGTGHDAGHPASGRRPDQRDRGAARRQPGRPARPGCPARRPGRAGPSRVPSAVGPVQAVLVGGYHGAWLPAAEAGEPAAGQRGAAPARRGGRGRGAGRAARGPVRPRRDRTGGPVPGPGVGRPVRPVLQRPAAHRRRPGAPGRPAPGPPGAGRPRALGRPGHRPRRLPPPGRQRAVRPQRAARLRGRGRAARAGAVQRHGPQPVPAGAGRPARGPTRTGADMEKQLRVDPVACSGHGACARNCCRS